MILIGPWLIWLGFAHGIRPFSNGLTTNYATLALSFITGLSGAYFIGKPVNTWPIGWQLICFGIYAVGLAFAMPMIALLSICTTGDCL